MKEGGGSEEEENGRPWEAVLPWLPPPDLAAVSATCRHIHRLSAAVTTRRAADASRGYERRPIPFRRPSLSRSSTPPYPCFLYTPFSLIGGAATLDPFSRPWPDHLSAVLPSPFAALATIAGGDGGCDCAVQKEGEEFYGTCSPASCACGFLSTADVTTECGPACGCNSGCPNRPTQGGAAAALEIRWTQLKSWGLFAAESIQKGRFICEYAGEYLTTVEARRRQSVYDELAGGGKGAAALLVLREHLPSGRACLRVNVDGTAAGNAARFINHECGGGNLAAALVRSSGLLLPRLCFFAGGDIQAGEELTFSYGEAADQQTGRPCFCGSQNCRGLLPSEET